MKKIESRIQLLLESLEIKFPNLENYLFYGSVITNMFDKNRSDIDILGFNIRDSNCSPRRVSFMYESSPVTLYIITKENLIDDGVNKKFGGFFAGKVLFPHRLAKTSPILTDAIMKSLAGFFGDLNPAFLEGELERTSKQLGLDCLRTMIHLYPGYIKYIAKLYLRNDRLEVLSSIEAKMREALMKDNKLESSNGLFKYTYSCLQGSEKIKILQGNFWSIGGMTHDDPHFATTYFNKSLEFFNHSQVKEFEVREWLNLQLSR